MEERGASPHRGARPNQVAMDRGERFKREIHARAAERGMFFDKDIAKAAGVSPNTLANWWQGKGLELSTLVAVAGVIDRSVFYLLDVWQGGEGHDYDSLVSALKRQADAMDALVLKLDGLAVQAMRQGAADALREVAEDLDGGGSPASSPDEPTT